MRKILFFITANILCVSFADADVTYEVETVEPAYTYAVINPNVNNLGFFMSAGEAFNAEKSLWDYSLPGESQTAINFRPGDPHPDYKVVNGKPSWYWSDSKHCTYVNNTTNCSTEGGPAVGMWSNNCPLDVKIVDWVAYWFSPTGVTSGLTSKVVCQRVTPVKKPPNDCGGVGNPILPTSGEKIQKETDYRSEDGVLDFTRTYRSGVGSFFSIATGSLIDNSSTQFRTPACYSSWTELKNNPTYKIVPYCFRYAPSQDPSYIIRLPSGRTLNFMSSSNGIAIKGATKETLEKKINDQGAVEWELTSEDNTKEVFDAEGKNIRTLFPSGKKRTYVYSDTSTPVDRAPREGMLIAESDSQGRTLQFTYNSYSQLIKMVDPKGNNYIYSYDDYNNLTSVSYPPNGSTRQYLYGEASNINNGTPCNGPGYSRLLTGIIGEDGKRFADFKYDCQLKGVSTEHAGGVEKFLLSYNYDDGSTTVTNPLNKKTIYRFTNIAGNRLVTSVEGQPTANCAGANKNYTYTAEGWIASKTDWNGNKTTYQYNTKGQEISRVEAAGSTVAKTITTEWHPTFNLKTKVTEPGKETTYTYDANGLLTNQTTRSLP